MMAYDEAGRFSPGLSTDSPDEEVPRFWAPKNGGSLSVVKSVSWLSRSFAVEAALDPRLGPRRLPKMAGTPDPRLPSDSALAVLRMPSAMPSSAPLKLPKIPELDSFLAAGGGAASSTRRSTSRVVTSTLLAPAS